jgi:two-component sensor histidine kinase
VRSRNGQWFDMRLRPYRTVDDRIEGVVISFINVTERRRERDALNDSKQMQEVLIAELEHRTRNLLSVVQSVSNRTLGNAASLDEYRARFTERLNALSPAPSIGWRSGQASVPLRELVELELRALGVAMNDPRLSIDGPLVTLPNLAAQMLALAFHELACGAIDHGALATPDGTLAVSWRTQAQDAASTRLLIEWLESGSSIPADALERRKSGRTLIEQTLAPQLHAEVQHELRPHGLRCAITLPLAELR